MGNHVIRDRIWESRKLARCSRGAAMAYPWIFLIADDHGRFEYCPRRIWTKVFGNREDVTLQEVTGWLEEYWQIGLMKRYHVNGDLGAWEGFVGRKASERRKSDYPDPSEFPSWPFNKLEAVAEDRPQPRDVPPPAPRQIDSRAETEQRQSGAEQNLAARAAPRTSAAGRPTWLSRPGELWNARWGEECEPPWSEMAGALSKPYKAFEARGEVDELWRRWERFLSAATTSQFARPVRFVQGLGEWADGARVRAGPKPSVGEQAMSEAKKFLEGKR